MKTGAFFNYFGYMSIVIESGEFLENTIRMNLPEGLPLGFV